jgi:endonuclease-3
VLRREVVAAGDVRVRGVVGEETRRIRGGEVEVAPDGLVQGRIPVGGFGGAIDRGDPRADRTELLGGDGTRLHRQDATVPLMARPRGAEGRAEAVVQLLAKEYPDAHTALDHTSAYELLVATILSAQTTDVRVNMVTPALFAKYPTVEDLAHADPAEVETLIQSTGFYRNKTKSIIGMAQAVTDRFGGKVPDDLDELASLPGVGRKTGNVVRWSWFHEPGLAVDTHVTRLSHLLKLTNETDAVKIERDLDAIVPPEERGLLSLRLIEHGRQVCIARRPRCDVCVLADVCPSAFTIGPIAKKKPAKKRQSPT